MNPYAAFGWVQVRWKGVREGMRRTALPEVWANGGNGGSYDMAVTLAFKVAPLFAEIDLEVSRPIVSNKSWYRME